MINMYLAMFMFPKFWSGFIVGMCVFAVLFFWVWYLIETAPTYEEQNDGSYKLKKD